MDMKLGLIESNRQQNQHLKCGATIQKNEINSRKMANEEDSKRLDGLEMIRPDKGSSCGI